MCAWGREAEWERSGAAWHPQGQRIATIGWLAGVIGVYLAVVVQGGWRQWSRRALVFAHFGLGMMLLAHAAPMTTMVERVPFAIFRAPGVDAVAMPWFGFAGAITILGSLYDLYREWVRVDPAPVVSTAATPSG